MDSHPVPGVDAAAEELQTSNTILQLRAGTALLTLRLGVTEHLALGALICTHAAVPKQPATS